MILGIDWLSLYHVVLDYHDNIITLFMSGASRVEGYLGFASKQVDFISKGIMIVEKGCKDLM